MERIKGGLPSLLAKLNDLEGIEWEPSKVVAEAGDIVRAVVNDHPQRPEHFPQGTKAEMERDEARANAHILAHCYRTDNRPPANIVKESLAYPVMSASVSRSRGLEVPQAPVTVMHAVRDFMARNGYDALYRSDDGEECGCSLATGLEPCSCMASDCQLGHWVQADNDGHGGAHPGQKPTGGQP